MPYDEVMDKFKAGTLRSGGDGAPVRKRSQAIAIMLSEKRKAAQGKEEYKPEHVSSGVAKLAKGARL